MAWNPGAIPHRDAGSLSLPAELFSPTAASSIILSLEQVTTGRMEPGGCAGVHGSSRRHPGLPCPSFARGTWKVGGEVEEYLVKPHPRQVPGSSSRHWGGSIDIFQRGMLIDCNFMRYLLPVVFH